MSTNIVYNGTTYTIPAINDVAWGAAVSDFLIAIPAGMLTKVGGSWALTGSDLDLGGSYGLVSLYLKSKTATLAQAGFIRMAKTDTIAWRNNANDGNNLLGVNTSNAPTFNTVEIPTISSSSTLTNKTIVGGANNISGLMNANIDDAAGIIYSKLSISAGEIAYSKLTLANSIVNADINTAAAIATSKINPDWLAANLKTTGSYKIGTGTKFVSIKAAPTSDWDMTLPTDEGVAGQYMKTDGSGVTSWDTPAGAGDVIGPSSSVDNELVKFDLVSGNAIQGSTSAQPTLSDDGILTLRASPIINNLTTAGILHNAVATGLVSSSLIVNADVHAAAAIAASKLGLLDGFTSGAGTLSAADTVLGGIQKLNGNIGLLNNIGVNIKAPTGFVTKSNMIFTWNESTARDLTITNTSGTYSYYIKGVLYTVAQTSTKTKQVTDTDGVWWFYFDESMTLQATQTFSADLFSIYCVVRSGYWDTTNKLWIIRSVESHEASMNWATRSYLHSVFGAMYLSGGATTTATLPGDKTLAQVRPTLDAVVFLDEDLQHTTTAHAATDAWRKLYRSGATGAWRAYTTGEPTIPVICDTADGAGDGGSTFINTFATGAWGLTVPVSNNNYFNTYLFATNDPTVGRTVIMIPGQAQSSNLGVAQGYGLQSLNLGSLPSAEFLPIVQLTWQYKDANRGDGPTENTAGVTLISATDLRLIRATGTSLVTSGAHNALSGRDAAAAHPATAVSNTPSGNLAADTVQAALNELQSDIDTRALWNSGGAVDANRLTVATGTSATLAALSRRSGTVAYDTDKASLVVDDGSAFKTLGGGLTVVYHAAASTEDGGVATGTPFATLGGNLYQYNLATYNGYCRLPQASTLLPSSTATIGFKTFGNDATTKRLVIQGYAGTETITYGGVAYTDVTLLPVNGWAILTWDATNSTWRVQDQATFVSGTFAGNLAITGALTVATGVTVATGQSVLDHVIEGSDTLGGAMTGTVKWSRVGHTVTLTSTAVITHGSASSVDSADNIVPASCRPPASSYNVYICGESIGRVAVSTSGKISLTYFDWAGSLYNRTDSMTIFSVSYVI